MPKFQYKSFFRRMLSFRDLMRILVELVNFLIIKMDECHPLYSALFCFIPRVELMGALLLSYNPHPFYFLS